jgi:hypothetical protein
MEMKLHRRIDGKRNIPNRTMRVEEANENSVRHESRVCERDIHHKPAGEDEDNRIEGAGEVS